MLVMCRIPSQSEAEAAIKHGCSHPYLLGSSVNDPDLYQMERVRDEHGGLSTTANAVKNKLNNIWQQLKSVRSKPRPIPFEAELCLLICSMFPGNFGIPFDDLVMDMMGLDLFKDVHETIRGVRYGVDHLIDIINDKKYHRNGDQIMLAYEDDAIKMSSRSFDLAVSIASSFPLVFRRETVVEKFPESNQFEACFGLSLVLRKINQLIDHLKCPMLELLQLQCKEDSRIPLDFFEGMIELRVLSLDVPSLPQSINVLKNLRTLRLKALSFGDLSVIGGLKNLEFLSISTSSLIDIPKEMGQLTNLRLLDLRSTDIAYISPGVLSRMLKLEELYLPLRFKRWGCKAIERDDYDEWGSREKENYDNEGRISASLGEMDDRERINASLSEIVFLSLKALQISIPNSLLLPTKSPIFKNIEDFKIVMQSNSEHQSFGEFSRNVLQLTGDAYEIKESGICDLMNRTRYLHLTRVRNLKKLKEVMYKLEDHFFIDDPPLQKMIISECHELEYAIELPKDDFSLPMLSCLHLSMLSNLKEICHGRLTSRFFLYLNRISIRFCHKLKNVFPLSFVRRSALKGIEILDCNEMEGIFFEDEDSVPLTPICIETLDLHSLPVLTGLLLHKNSMVDPIRHDNWHWGFFTNNEDFSVKKEDATSHMKIYSAFTSKLAGHWSQNLKRLKIAFCDLVQVVFFLEENQTTSKAFISLEKLELHGLRNLVHIWFQFPPKIIAFNNLECLVLSDCSTSYLFSSRVARLLVQLQKIYISRCEKMEEVIADDDENERKDRIMFPRLKLLELQHLPNLKIFSTGTYEVDLPLLESLKLNQCNKMKCFSYGLVKTPMLMRVEVNGSLYSFTRDLNATIMRVTNPHTQMFKFVNLMAATKDFSSDNFLGGKDLGKIYQGYMNTSTFSLSETNRMPVAIKKMDSQTRQAFMEWESEVDILGKQSHPNLVKLLGYCWEEKQLLLVYEFVERGSLDSHLRSSNHDKQPLSWDTRIKIAIGAACGLNFLHTSEEKVVHGNIKSSNILLDGDYNAKITDFGYSLTTMDSHARRRFALDTMVKGPARVIDPEYYRTGLLNVKSDVYSFGAVLLQLMTGSWSFDSCYGHEFMFENWRPILSQESELKSIMDPTMLENYSPEAVLRTGELSAKCMEYDHRRRPTMAEVLEELRQIDAINENWLLTNI